MQHKTHGETMLMTAVKSKKFGVVAMLIYCGALSRRTTLVWAGEEAEMYLHEIAYQVPILFGALPARIIAPPVEGTPSCLPHPHQIPQ